jgi:nitric oxide reductase NorD protein
LRSDAQRGERLEALGLLASAIAQRALQVAASKPGEPAWTNGSVVFVDAHAAPRAQVEALAVQAALLAAGSLDADVVRRLAWRPMLARRYLAVEGHRALAAIVDVLPRSLRSLMDPGAAKRVDSAAASLAVARSREPIPDPPRSFGAIRVRPLLATDTHADDPQGRPEHVPHRQQDRSLGELPADDDHGGSARDLFSSPGGGGALGRLLRRMLQPVRRLRGGGAPGADAATHRTRTGAGGVRSTVLSTAATGAATRAPDGTRGPRYPEWDVERRRYRRNWCSVLEVEPRLGDAGPLAASERHALRRPLARLGTGLDSCHRQVQGNDVDIDAAVEAHVDRMAGSARGDAVYLDSLRRRRDLSVLILLDISGSTAEPATAGLTVHEQQREVAAALALALHEIGDRVALYAFHSQGRSSVQLVPVKRFDDDLGPLVLRRLAGLVPAAYSRLGAAIRHGTAVVRNRGATSRRLLVVLSDGLAYDHGYEPAYGAADARRALAEARSQGIGCLCLTISADTHADALRRVFGSAAHATIPRPEQLSRVIGPLFRSALRSAEVRRPVSP